jgi:hypothetical protein
MYWRHAAIAVAAILVIVLVKVFERVNRRHELSARLYELLGDPWTDYVVRFAFVLLVALVSLALRFVGVAAPAELEQFIPSEVSSIILAILASSSYRTGRKSTAPGGGSV